MLRWSCAALDAQVFWRVLMPVPVPLYLCGLTGVNGRHLCSNLTRTKSSSFSFSLFKGGLGALNFGGKSTVALLYLSRVAFYRHFIVILWCFYITCIYVSMYVICTIHFCCLICIPSLKQNSPLLLWYTIQQKVYMYYGKGGEEEDSLRFPYSSLHQCSQYK